jgi:hypothetical protein
LRLFGALLLGAPLAYAALNTYLLLKIRPLPISFIPSYSQVEEDELEAIAA